MKSKLIAYFKDERGQTSTEYILLVAVAASIAIKFKEEITKKLFGEGGNGGILNTVLKEDKFDILD